MTAYSASDAAIEGFRISRRHPRVVLGWALFSFVASVTGALITLSMPKEAAAALEAIANEQAPDGGALLEMLALASPILIVGLLVQRMMDAAVYRLMLRPEDNRFGYLRLGADELRLTALRLIYLILAVLLIALVQFAIVLLTLVVSAVGQSAAVFVASMGELISVVVAVVLAVRLSLASVITFQTGRLALFESWDATRGQFWPLLGAYALAFCSIVAIGLLVVVVFTLGAGVLLIATGGSMADLRSITQPKAFTFMTYLNPYVVAYTMLGCVFTAVYSAVIAAPGAYIYQALRQTDPADTETTATAYP